MNGIVAFLLGLVTLCTALGPNLPQALYRGRTDVVMLDVAVADGRGPVRNLTKDDFSIRDNGVIQEILDFGREALPLDVRLTVDISGSMTARDRAVVNQAVSHLIESLGSEDRAALTVFGTHISERTRLQHPPIAISLSGVGSGSAVIDAMVLSLVTPALVGRRQFSLFMTDGNDNASYFDERLVLETAKHCTSPITVVLASDRPSRSIGGVLRAAAIQTGGETLALESGDDLSKAFIEALDNFRASYVLRYAPTGVVLTGWHDVQVSVRTQGYQVRVRRGYWAKSAN
jgi:hypothetical protein